MAPANCSFRLNYGACQNNPQKDNVGIQKFILWYQEIILILITRLHHTTSPQVGYCEEILTIELLMVPDYAILSHFIIYMK